MSYRHGMAELRVFFDSAILRGHFRFVYLANRPAIPPFGK